MPKLRVVIVDDEPVISGLISKRLSKDAPDFAISTLGSAEECLKYIERHEVDCILTDYQMPDMDGMKMLSRLRQKGDETPVIFITGQGSEEVAREAFKNGAYDYFTKEIGFAHFPRIINSIEQAVRQRRAVDAGTRSEAAHRESERLLSSIFSSITDGISIIDTEYNIIKVNPAIEEWYNHKMPLIGQKCYRAYRDRDEVCEVCPSKRTMDTGAPATDVVPVIEPGGVIKGWTELSSSPFIDETTGQLRGVIEYVRDVTAREDATLKARRTLESIVGAIRFGMIIVGRNRKVRHANQTALAMMGLSDEKDIAGRICHKNICPAEEGKCPIFDLGQEVDLSEKFLLTKDGGKIPILKTVTPFTLDGEDVLLETFVDITAQKDAQRQVGETRAFLQSVIDGAADPIMVIDPDHTVTLMNDAARRLSQHPKGDGLKCYQLSHGVDKPCSSEEGHECPLRQVTDTGRPTSVMHRHKGADGSSVWVEITASPMFGDDGRLVSVIEFSRDVTYRVNMEQQRADFYAMVTHDIRGSLTTILGYSDILTTDKAADMDEESLEMVASVARSARRLSSIVDSYLAFSKLEAGHARLNLAPADVGALLGDTAGEYAELAQKKGITFETRADDGLPRILIDAVYTQRAVSNLIENALNYTPDGGRVTLGACLESGGRAGRLVIYVSDTGPGIPEADREKVFDKYFRSAAAAGIKGSGLGLAVVKAVMDAHGGRVELDCPGSGGCTFRLIFNITENPSSQSSAHA